MGLLLSALVSYRTCPGPGTSYQLTVAPYAATVRGVWVAGASIAANSLTGGDCDKLSTTRGEGEYTRFY